MPGPSRIAFAQSTAAPLAVSEPSPAWAGEAGKIAVTTAFRDVVVGTLLGNAIGRQVRAIDYVAAAATVAPGVLAVGDVLFLNIKGWLSAPVRASREYGDRHVWPGYTIGIALLGHGGHAGQRLMLSWGSAIGSQISPNWAAQITP